MTLEELSNIESLPDEILLKIVKLSSVLSKEEQDKSFPSYLRHLLDFVRIFTTGILECYECFPLKNNYTSHHVMNATAKITDLNTTMAS